MVGKREPWNKGEEVGAKLPFAKPEVRTIKKKHKENGNLDKFVLFSVAIDTSFRSGDLLRLTGKDVRSSNGMIKQVVIIQMEKTKKTVRVPLFPDTRKALLQYMIENNIEDDDYLFPGKFPKTHLSKESFRRFIKSCAEMIGLNPVHYSAHSTRYTRPIFMIIENVQETVIAELMGVRLETVKHYTKSAAVIIALQHPM